MAHIFISYARKDAEAANRLVGTLANAGYKAWIDREIPGGDLWKRRIVEAIDGADAFLVLLSPNSVASDNVRRELDVADARKKLILPLVIAPMKIPQEMEYSLTGRQTIDFAADADAADRQLLSVLRSLRAIEEKSGGRVDVTSTPSEERKIWEKKKADLKSRRDANSAEWQELMKEDKKLKQEWESTSSAEIKQQKLEKMQAITRQLDFVGAESTALSKEEIELLRENPLWPTAKKSMDESRKMLEESNKLVRRILTKGR